MIDTVNLVALVIQRETGVDPLSTSRSSVPARHMLYVLCKLLYNFDYAAVTRALGHHYETTKKMVARRRFTNAEVIMINQIESLLVVVDPDKLLNQQIDEARNRLNRLLLLREKLQ